MKLQCEDLDLKRGLMRVWRTKRKQHVQETLAIGKELRDHLKEYLEWLPDNQGPVLRGKRGPLTVRGLQQLFKTAAKNAGLPAEFSIHSCRHSLAVQQLKKTNNLRMVQKQLGHTSPVTTANMYADIAFEDMQESLNGLWE